MRCHAPRVEARQQATTHTAEQENDHDYDTPRTKAMTVALILVSAGQAGAGILRTPNGNFTGKRADPDRE